MGASPPALVADLVERFDRDRKVLLSGDDKEEQLRAEFFNPFFESLGWDSCNSAVPAASGSRVPTCHRSSTPGAVR